MNIIQSVFLTFISAASLLYWEGFKGRLHATVDVVYILYVFNVKNK